MANLLEFEYTRPKLYGYQVTIIDAPARFTVTVAATKTGKTTIHIVWLLEQALGARVPHRNYWWVAPVSSQAKIAWTRMKNQVTARGFFKSNETNLTLTLPNGSVIWFKTAEKPDNLYGEDVYAAVFDEFTRAREEAYTALYSTLTATGGKCKFIGNAKGKKSWGYRLAMRAKNGEKDHAYFKVTAYDAVDCFVPGITLDIIEQAKRDLTVLAFNELYMAEESDDGANPFGIEDIRGCIKQISGLPVVAFGVDLAKYSDWTVIIGIDKNGDIAYFERFQGEWGQQIEKIIQIIGRTPAVLDSTGVGDAIAEFVTKRCPSARGLNYASGVKTKQQLMEALGHAVKTRQISILAGVIQDEMESFEFEYNNGRVTYSTLGHDDCVNSLALANYCKINYPKAVAAWT